MDRQSVRRTFWHAAVVGLVAASSPLLIAPAGATDLALEVDTAQGLAAAITAANANVGADTVLVTNDLTLSAALPAITGPLAIVGSEPASAVTINTAGFPLIQASGNSWTEPTGAPTETRLAVGLRNLTLTGGTRGGGSMVLLTKVHATFEDVAFVGNVGGWEGNVYAKEGGTSLRLNRVSVTGQSGTLFTNDHGGTPNDGLDAQGRLLLTDASFDNRLYIDQSQFSGNTGCVLYTHRFVSISDSTFSNSGQVCLSGVSTRRIARTTFESTALQFMNPWGSWGSGPGPAYAELDAVSVGPSLTVINSGGGSTHLVVHATVVCGAPIASYGWANPFVAPSTMLGNCPPAAPTWTDQALPELGFGRTVDDGVTAVGVPAPAYAVASGALPAGLVLDTATGKVTGAPVNAGGYSFVLSARNATGTVTSPFSGNILAPAPTALVVTPGNAQLSVAFTPGPDGGSAITNYQYSTNGGTTWTTRSPLATTSPIVITGLTNGDSYSVKLRVLNGVEFGTGSATATGTPVAPAVAPPITQPPATDWPTAVTPPTTTNPPTVEAIAAPPTIPVITGGGAGTAPAALLLRGGVVENVPLPNMQGHPFAAGAAVDRTSAIAASPDGKVFTTNGSDFHGEITTVLNGHIISVALRPHLRIDADPPAAASQRLAGYWLLAADGGVFAFGNAGFFGSTGNIKLNEPATAMTPTPSGNGYWLVAADGGVFSFGDANFFGSTSNIKLNKPIVAMVSSASGRGYFLIAADGGVFTFGDAMYHGSGAASGENVIGAVPTPTGHGYWLVADDKALLPFGDATK